MLKLHRVERRPTWGTCAGLILLAEAADATKKGGQELIGGLDVRVHRNHFGRQIESFEADLDLPFLTEASPKKPFHAIFIRAPIVAKVLPHRPGVQTGERERESTVVAPSKTPKDEEAAARMSQDVEVLAVLPGRMTRGGAETSTGDDAGDIVAVRQGNVFGTSFHPELTDDVRIHAWWLEQVAYAQN
jgi:pyridoxal 5'-phosphate synthase pdxT subunit